VTEPEFLEPDVVLFVHGLEDEGLLHSALGRPVNKLAYAEPGSPDLFDLAAAYAYGPRPRWPHRTCSWRSERPARSTRRQASSPRRETKACGPAN